jgi:hypothetical protein
MSRPKQQFPQLPGHPTSISPAVCAENVLPEHVLLRWLHESRIVENDIEPDIEFALQMATAVAASQAMAGPMLDSAAIGDDDLPAAADEAWEVEHECFDLADLASELGLSADDDQGAGEAEPIEEVTMTNEFEGATSEECETTSQELDQPTVESIEMEPATEQAPLDAEAESTNPAVTEPVSAEVELAHDDASDEHILGEAIADEALAEEELLANAEVRREPAKSQFEDAELGALMAEIVHPGSCDPDEEQHNLQARFRDADEASEQAPAVTLADHAEGVAITPSDSIVVEPAETVVIESVETSGGNLDEQTDTAATVGETEHIDSAVDEPPAAKSGAEASEVHQELETFSADREPDFASELAPETDEIEAQPEEPAVNETNAATEAVHDNPEVPVFPAAESTEAAIQELETETSSSAPDNDEPTEELTTASAESSPQEPTQQDSAKDEEFALTNATVDRVQDFLGELKSALVEMAQRPQSTPVDVGPLVQALQDGFDRSAEQAAQTSTAVASLSEHMTQFGRNIEGGVQQTIHAMGNNAGQAASASLSATQPHFVERSTSQAAVLGAVALAVIGWSILFWIKTGSPRLAIGTLIGANAIACCLLLTRRDRS